MTPVIDYEEIECEMDLGITDFHFYNRADASTGYFWVNTEEDAIPNLEQEKNWEYETAEKWGYSVDYDRINEIDNQIALVRILQEAGYRTGVLIYVWN
jgi:alpha-mannosidase